MYSTDEDVDQAASGVEVLFLVNCILFEDFIYLCGMRFLDFPKHLYVYEDQHSFWTKTGNALP